MAAEQRYRVTERLEAGGMAEVFKGESLSVQGFKKQVAIKRVLPHLAQNKNFISMFLDEARLGARLTHANIVTVFDIGAADNTYFIVMEFVDGCNLKTVIEQYRQQGRRIGVKEAVYLCLQACAGLSFAHELQSEEGEDLHIVHRDISPPNILLSKRGEVKVTDFGLAKATTQLEKTDPGVVKGKFSYLSPEAAMGEPVDARTDIFALGIVLWEMLAGRRLFLGETDYQTVKLVQQANIPSLARLNPEVDADLETVLGKALARNKEERYQTAREMGDALSGYLFGKQLKVNSFDIATLVKGVIDAKKAAKTGGPREASIIDRLIQEELLRFTSLDDMSDPLAPNAPGAAGLSPEAGFAGDLSEGAKPLDAGSFENPADWFSDDEDVVGAIGRGTSSKSEPGWRESGIEDAGEGDLASVLEDVPEPAPARVSAPEPARVSRPTPEPVAQPQVVQQRVAPAAPERVSAPPQQKKSSAAVYVGIAIALAAGGAAAAYFAGLIPH
ncbi:serine/threonine protein kinase [Sandaracinus amylolyticus]|uniref:Serine/threonine protein kinase PrkC, regulator of stationary phase n=1 Tax=Sandaracinus amylolyticus TaxID=927083 RepID=A0A0F6SH97_9BACT|nr:serine/threonine-protein kinase [Sandaracinus amylolyticus]AKF10064.1 Serine/threonine protein kinase PrkC, regulator of stationary phase [Sandaracinus amylolyticus]